MGYEKTRSLLGIFFVVVFFIAASYLVQTNASYFEELMGNNFWGMLVYIDILILAVVFAPINGTPFVAIASNLWGWFSAALLSIAGWTLGALFAFTFARVYGVPLVKKVITLEKIHRLENMVPERHLFWSIVFLRMAVPIDALSYVLGLLSRITLGRYIFATMIGVAPYAFLFSYLGALPFFYQIVTVGMGIFIIVIGFGVSYFYKKRKRLKPN